MTIESANTGIDEALLTSFEARLGQLPEDYRRFVLKNNGIVLFGCPVFAVPSADGVQYWGIVELCGVPDAAGVEDVDLYEDFWGWPYPKDSIPVATDGCGNTYLMALSGARRGNIFFFDHETCEAGESINDLEHLLPSFDSLFAGIRDYEPNSPESERLFHTLQERKKKNDEAFRQILEPSKPWWRFW